jgi:DnaJ-class molecular chaperone
MIAGAAGSASVYRGRVADADDEQPAETPCDACRGTGVVISHLGGEPHEEPCPWCEGSGVRRSGHDAQARWRAATP